MNDKIAEPEGASFWSRYTSTPNTINHNYLSGGHGSCYNLQSGSGTSHTANNYAASCARGFFLQTTRGHWSDLTSVSCRYANFLAAAFGGATLTRVYSAEGFRGVLQLAFNGASSDLGWTIRDSVIVGTDGWQDCRTRGKKGDHYRVG